MQLPTDIAKELSRFDPECPIGSALTPPASWYTTQAFHDLERDTVFRNHWQFVGRLDQVELPGDYFTGVFMGWPYVVVRSNDGNLRAFFNVCSHHGTCVTKGEGNSDEFVCPYHGWAYSHSGDLKRAPHAGAIAALKTRNLHLKPIPVDTWGPFVALHFGSPTRKLKDQLQSLSSLFKRDPFVGMKFIRRVPYEIPCNWKVFVDNYLDGGYHVPFMHPDLSGHLDTGSYKTTLGDYYSMQACAGQTDERIGSHADYAWIYPNFMVDRYGPWLNTITAIPTSPDRCITVIDYYYDGAPEPDFLRSSMADSDQVQQEDIEICQMVQTGLNSGVYEQGVYAPKFEGSMLLFHQLLTFDFNNPQR